MNISYDVKADALSIKLIPGLHEVETRRVDEDIALDFDELERLVSIEVLDASKRLDLRYLVPVSVAGDFKSGKPRSSSKGDRVWIRLKDELIRRKHAGEPVLTLKQRRKNWVVEVAEDYVTVKRDESGNTCPITRREFEDGTKGSLTKLGKKWAIVSALREIVPGL